MAAKIQRFTKLLNLYAFLILMAGFFYSQAINAQGAYKRYFTNERLRLEFTLQGNADTLTIQETQYFKEPQWGGNPYQLIDPFNYGEMRIEVFDSASNHLIYSYGFSSLFCEWQATQQAKSADTSFAETQSIPFPRNSVRIDMLKRNDAQFEVMNQLFFNPENSSYTIAPPALQHEIRELLKSGSPAKKVDLLILAEGFRQDQQELFFEKAGILTQALFLWEPYSDYKTAFNITAVFIPSEEEGADIPGDSIYVNSALNTSFYTFGSERYLTSTDIPGIYREVSDLPYDQICIMVNSSKYGGGAIYNNFTFFTVDTLFSEFLFQHEFAHAFAALADEYYSSSVAYLDYFPYNIEPYQVNITTLVDFNSKWKDMLSEGIAIPTPDSAIYNGVVGVFEGGGYSAKGIYRPTRTCAMKDKTTNYFCPVCEKAIADMIRYYTEK